MMFSGVCIFGKLQHEVSQHDRIKPPQKKSKLILVCTFECVMGLNVVKIKKEKNKNKQTIQIFFFCIT